MIKNGVHADHRERGAGTLEYFGIVILAVLVVGAVVAAVSHFNLSQKIACNLEAVVAGEGGSCSAEADTVFYEAGDRDEGADHDSANPNGVPEDTDSWGDDVSEPSTHFSNATNQDDPVDNVAVSEAADDFDARGAWWQRLVGGSGLEDISEHVKGLNGPEMDAYFDQLSDDQIVELVETMDSRWTDDQRHEFWSDVAKEAAPSTLDRLSQFTTELRPAFDDVPLSSDKSAHEQELEERESWAWGEREHELFVDGANPQDVSQGGLGDCWFMASLMSTAHQQPEIIEDAITVTENGSYEVRLFIDGEPVYQIVDPRVLVDENGNDLFHQTRYDVDSAEGDPERIYELWPSIMEKALAQENGSFGEISGGFASEGLEIVTGVPSTSYDLDGGSAPDLQTLADHHEAGDMQSFSSLQTPEEGSKMEDVPYVTESGHPLSYSHAYVVKDVDVEADTVTLWNPWGTDRGEITVTGEEYGDLFKRVDVNEGTK